MKNRTIMIFMMLMLFPYPLLNTSSSCGRKRSYTVAFKLKVVDYAEKHSKRETSQVFCVDRKRVQEWCKQKEDLAMVGKNSKTVKRLGGGGRRPLSVSIENQLVDYLRTKRTERRRVTRKAIAREAVKLHREAGNETFIASDGWLAKFMKRNKVSLRRKTTVSQHLPKDLVPKLVNFVLSIRRLRLKNEYPLELIGGMDETALWLDMPAPTTLAFTGERSVPIRTTGHEKNRFTVCLAAMADGTKLPPFIVFKGKRRDKQADKVIGVVVEYSDNGWMNEELTERWVKVIWRLRHDNSRRLFLWDSYKCHKTDRVKSLLSSRNTDTVIVPGGTTSLVQAADVSWNKPFKGHYQQRYDEWIANGEKTYTKGGNERAPTKKQVCEWTLEAWRELTPELIKKSFRACAVTLSVDGVEDDQITCMKEGHPAAAAKPTLLVETQKLLKSARGELEEDDDPFADLDSDMEVDSGSLRDGELDNGDSGSLRDGELDNGDSGSLRDGELDNGDSDHEGESERLLELFESSDEEDFFGF